MDLQLYAVTLIWIDKIKLIWNIKVSPSVRQFSWSDKSAFLAMETGLLSPFIPLPLKVSQYLLRSKMSAHTEPYLRY